MPDNPYVRVTDRDTGHKRTIRESQVAHGNYTVLKADATDPTGLPLPPEFNAVGSEAKPAAKSAPAKRTATKKAAAKKAATKPLSNNTDGQTAKTEKE